MGVKLLNNSLYSSEKFAENSQNLKKYCMFLNGYIKKYIFDKDKDKNDFNKEFPITGYLHYKYNIFTFPNHFIYQLFLDIQSMFLKITKNVFNFNLRPIIQFLKNIKICHI